MGWKVLTPQPHDHVFQGWWRNLEQLVDKSPHKAFNSAIILVVWWLWKHQNVCVFEGQSSCAQQLLQSIRDDAVRWSLAGVVGLADIWPE
jgi:hypothetical protein